MSILLADIDATCASLGINDGIKYILEPDALHGLKHLIWILKRDTEEHEFRLYFGQKQVLKTDLIPMLINNYKDSEFADVLLRLIVNLTNPTLLLYNGEVPKEGQKRGIYLSLTEVLQGYKTAFTQQSVWAALGNRLQKMLEIDWAERTEEQGLIIERILVLTRNVLQVPANPEAEKRADYDASLHDQVLWALHQAGLLDLILFILSSEYEHQYHLHTLEIVCLLYREQNATSLADASLQRSTAEKHHDELELMTARKKEKAKLTIKVPAARHSRFGGTYVIKNIKSISDNNLICHQSLQKALNMEFDKDKSKLKKSSRHVKDEEKIERKSAFSIRLFLREFCIEILNSSYNNIVRHVRRALDRNRTPDAMSNDDSYLLWAIRFFMEFNRASGFQLDLISESMSVPCFHWIITRIEHDLDMMTSDKSRARIWARRLHVGVMAYREMLESLQVLQKLEDQKAKDLFLMLQNNVFYVLEYREVILHLLINYNEAHSTRAYLRDVIETTHLFFKMLEKFCQGTVRVQDKKRAKHKKKSSGKGMTVNKNSGIDQEDLEDIWMRLANEVSTCLANQITLPEEEHPIPFDAVSETSIDDQKGECMIRIHSLLRDEKYEHAILLMRAAREVWPEDDTFGSISSAPEDELLLMKDIFLANLPRVQEKERDVHESDYMQGNDEEEDYDDEEEDGTNVVETDFRFEDFAKRLLNPKIIRACTLVLSDWEKIATKTLKSAVTILHRIAVGCKMPAMLYQATLFRVFQRALNAPKDSHHEELRRLGIYIIRQFVSIAPSNPKIFAELLFYKSIKEANAIEMGYDELNGGTGKSSGGKGSWTEEQEDELRKLFMENQANPATDQDVIDWIVENLVDQTRTRRGVLKKLKELGLIFKAPTKKSTAANAPKRLWNEEQDQMLKDLYDEKRVEENCLQIIEKNFENVKSKQAIIKRMIELGLIADKSEILPSKRKRAKKSNAGDSDDDSEDENGERRSVPKRTIPKVSINHKKIKSIMMEIEESMKESVEWLVDSLKEAAEDYEEPDEEDPDNGIPLVAIMESQREALENEQFKRLLVTIGLMEPFGNETYWRIPVTLTPQDLDIRCRILTGEYEEPAEPLQSNPNIDSDNEEDVSEDMFSAWRKKMQKMDNLVYSKSDEEDEVRAPLKMIQEKAKKSTGDRKNKNDEKDENEDKEKENEDKDNNKYSYEMDIEEIQRRLDILDAEISEENSHLRASFATRRAIHHLSDSDESNDGLSSRLLVSDNEDEDSNDMEFTANKSKKRERSENSDDSDVENSFKRPKNTRKIISSDEED